MEQGLYTFGSMFRERVRWQRSVIGMDRLLLQIDWGGMPFSLTKRSVEILGTEVAPALRGDPGSPPAT